MNELYESFFKLLNALGVKDKITKEQISNLPFDEDKLKEFKHFLRQNNIEIVEGEETYFNFFVQLTNEMNLYPYSKGVELLESIDDEVIPDDLKIELSKYHYSLILSVIKRCFPFGFAHLPCYGECDAFQDGYIGLVKALNHFKPGLGFSFSTYATYWIYEEIYENYVSFSHILHYSRPMKDKLGWYCRKKNEYLTKNGNMNLKEFAVYIGLSYEKVLFLEKHVGYGLSLEETYKLPNSDVSGVELKYILPTDYNLEEEVVDKVFVENISSDMSALTNFERKIIINRYGLQDGKFRTYHDISLIVTQNGKNVSRESIRMGEKRALKKLRKRTVE